jgi:hypothetical protein
MDREIVCEQGSPFSHQRKHAAGVQQLYWIRHPIATAPHSLDHYIQLTQETHLLPHSRTTHPELTGQYLARVKTAIGQ